MALSKNQKPKIDFEVIAQAVSESTSWCALARKLFGNHGWGNVRTAKRYVEYYQLSTAHFFKPKPPVRKLKYDINEMFVEDSKASNSVLLKYFKRLYPPEKCAECGVGNEWNGKPLTLHLDHINGHATDWRVENCRYLCPNCHYQTDTHGTKRGYRKPDKYKVTAAELAEAYDEYGSYKLVGQIYGISDRSVKNMVKRFERFEGKGG